MRTVLLILSVVLTAAMTALVIGYEEERRATMFDVSRMKPRPPASPPPDCAEEEIEPCPPPPFRPLAVLPPVVHRVKPKLTEEQRRTGIRGVVILRIGIRRDGTVGGVCVLKPLPCGLSGAAIDAVRQWRFEKREGEAIADVIVHFTPSTTF